jgi:monofunctional glycosyltransferase
MEWLKRSMRRWYWSIPRDEAGKMRWGLYFRRLVVKMALWFFGLSIGTVLLYTFLPIPVTPLMIIRLFEQGADSTREARLSKDWVSLDEISQHLQLAVVCGEDQEFLEHDGFDFEAIEKAVEYNQTHKRKLGASTISQQTAKNVFLWPARSWIRKGLEVYFTFLIETIWSKKRIMTAYLNIAEFGDGIYGAEAAAQHFYHKPAKNLNKEEAAMLAAILPGPLLYSPINPSDKVKRRQRKILFQMRAWGGHLDYEDPNTPRVNDK